MKLNLLFILINTALYPLSVYFVADWLTDFFVSGGSDAMGNGMQSGFTYIIVAFSLCIVILITSLIVSRKRLKSVLPAVFSMILGLLIVMMILRQNFS